MDKLSHRKILAVFNNHNYDYYSYGQIAEMLGLSVGKIVYAANKKYPEVKKERIKRRTVDRLFENGYIVDNNSGCWIWKGSFVVGYARITGKTFERFSGKQLGHSSLYGHRYSYIKYNGEIKKGKHVLHKCGNSKCVNPKHLYLGDHQQNMKDRDRDGNSTGTKFNYDVAEEIRELYKNSEITYHDLADLYNCSVVSIYRIINHITYKTKEKRIKRDAVVELYKSGFSLSEIMKRLDIKSHTSIYIALRLAGVKPKRKKKAK